MRAGSAGATIFVIMRHHLPAPRLHPIVGYATKPGPSALAALTGRPTQQCEAALRQFQHGTSRRGTPSSAIEPAAAQLDLGLRLVDDLPPWYKLKHVFEDRELQCGIVETGNGPNRKPHFAAFDRHFFADELNRTPVPYHQRLGNPGRNGDGRRVRNVWIPDDLAQARLRAEYRDHPNRLAAFVARWDKNGDTIDLRHFVDQQDWATVARCLDRVLATGKSMPVPALNNPHSAGATDWLWSAEETGRAGLLGRVFPPGGGRITAVFAAGLGRDGIRAFQALKREAALSRSSHRWPVDDWSEPPVGRWCFGRDILELNWSPKSRCFQQVNPNPVGSRDRLDPDVAPNSWGWFESLMAWAWFGLHRLDFERGQWRPASDDWVPPRRNAAHDTLTLPPRTNGDEAKALLSP